MDAKTFKSDITYAVKKLLKEGKEFLSDNDTPNHPEYEAGKLKFDYNTLSPFEALLIVKQPKLSVTDVYRDEESGIETVFDTGIRPTHLHLFNGHIVYNINSTVLLASLFGISERDASLYFCGEDGVTFVSPEDMKNDFYKIGVYIREKFLTCKPTPLPKDVVAAMAELRKLTEK